jgi:hypothetical protein
MNQMEGCDMKQRYVVYNAGRAFAVIHAANVSEAIRLACSKTSKGYEPKDCTAILFEITGKRR